MCKAQGTQGLGLPPLLMAFDDPGRKDYSCERLNEVAHGRV
jgi:hypothetical protein